MAENNMPEIPDAFGHAHDGNGNQPLSFDHGPVNWSRSVGCSTIELYSIHQMRDYASKCVSASRAEDLEAMRKAMEVIERCKPLSAYGRIGTRDVEQAEFRRGMDAALALLRERLEVKDGI